MREILFRGKTDKGEWVYGYCVYQYGAHMIYLPDGTDREYGFDYHHIIPETVGQFTGLVDKNGKKIFEGDIIKTVTNSFDRDEFITEIKFGARSGVQGFYLANGRMMFYFGQKDLTVMNDTEVIGNIHDNPELLEGGEE